MTNQKDIQPMPALAVTWQPGKIMENLATLRDQADLQAVEAICWYYDKKKSKNLWSRILRFWAILFTVLGGLVPILSATGLVAWIHKAANDQDLRLAELHFNQFGYVLIGLAAGCVAFDRFFGFSTNWIRYIGAALRIETARVRFLYDWQHLVAPLKGQEPSDECLHELLDCLQQFGLAIREAIERETGAWITEFQTNLSQLDKETKALFEQAHKEKEALEHRAQAKRTGR